jgi:SAM-dependent methyltransferase
MLKLDEREAARRRLHVRIVEAPMDDLAPLEESSFDLVHQPVSTCYVPNIGAVYREVARVPRSGGMYISQHKQPTSLQVTHRDSKDRYVLGIDYYHEGPLPAVPDRSYRENGTVEFLHSWGELVGGLCRAGFAIEDLAEPVRADAAAVAGEIGHRGRYVPPYVRIKARRLARVTQSASPLWIP